MRVLGIDPGFAITGYSIIDYIGNKFYLRTSGAILTEAKTSFPLRLEKINKELAEIIETYNPDAMSIEELFFNNNAKTAINVAQARGVILVTARMHNFSDDGKIIKVNSSVPKGYGVKNIIVYIDKKSGEIKKIYREK